jgi:diguanylate cyclase (GGDEF)-like protein
MPKKNPGQRLVSPQAIIAIASIVILLASLCVLALNQSGALATMLLVVEGLGAATIMLFRQLRKTTQSLIASEARAQHLAQHDGLTALPNRARFLSRLGQEVDELRRSPGFVAVIVVGLDQFNQLKDAFGYECGDQLMEVAAQRLSGIAAGELQLARIGADAFAMIETDSDRIDELNTQLREVIASPFALSSGSTIVTCSIGVSAVLDAAADSDALLRKAELALRKARSHGGDQVQFYEPAMDAALERRKVVETDLHAALVQRELTVVYQPQLSVSGAVVGVEALVRWYHRERGDVPPEYFARVAEESGLIHDLGRFTIDQVFADARRWRNLKVAFNVSASQLVRADYVSELATSLKAAGIGPGRFEIEITEAALLRPDAQMQQNLQALRNLGVDLALDDFGVGYSSLNYLLRHRVDRIKIDRSFVKPLGVDPSVESVVGAMIKLGDALNLRVVADGVETEAQRNRLVQLGCKEFQGSFLSAPLPAGVVDALVSAKRAIAA